MQTKIYIIAEADVLMANCRNCLLMFKYHPIDTFWTYEYRKWAMVHLFQRPSAHRCWLTTLV